MAEKPSVIQLAILLVAICGQKESVTVGLEAISKQTDAASINAAIDWLSELVQELEDERPDEEHAAG